MLAAPLTANTFVDASRVRADPDGASRGDRHETETEANPRVSTRVAVTRFNGTMTFTPAASATVPKMNDTVTFTVTSAGVSIDHIDWNFGDGQLLTTSGRSAAHPYGSTGLKTVTAKVVAFGASESTPITVQVDIKP